MILNSFSIDFRTILCFRSVPCVHVDRYRSEEKSYVFSISELDRVSTRRFQKGFLKLEVNRTNDRLLFSVRLLGTSKFDLIESVCRPIAFETQNLTELYFCFPGPAFWGLINPEWSLCHKGMRQSPVNLDPDKLLYDPNLTELLVSRHRVSSSTRSRLRPTGWISRNEYTH